MPLDFKPSLAQRRLVGHLRRKGLAELGEVIGHEAQSGVAGLGLDDRRTAGDLGLTPQRLQLTAQFSRQIGQPREVALHRIQLAQGLLLALAVLEHARSLFDEPPSILGGRVQDRVELPLADDDVHLPTDTGVRQQLLDVQESAGCAVDGVLRPAVAKESARDRDLGVLDG